MRGDKDYRPNMKNFLYKENDYSGKDEASSSFQPIFFSRYSEKLKNKQKIGYKFHKYQKKTAKISNIMQQNVADNGLIKYHINN